MLQWCKSILVGLGALITCAIYSLSASGASADEGTNDEFRQLAILIAAPHNGETAMHEDLSAMYQSLRQRGFSSKEILSLEGELNRQQLMCTLQEAHRRITDWRNGAVFFFYSGHGTYYPQTALTVEEARPALCLDKSCEVNASQARASSVVYWDEVFSTLAVPQHIRLILVPDC
ncbi:MAG TPA: caspase family protein [Candidatus Obscuribacterales bacterium]